MVPIQLIRLTILEQPIPVKLKQTLALHTRADRLRSALLLFPAEIHRVAALLPEIHIPDPYLSEEDQLQAPFPLPEAIIPAKRYLRAFQFLEANQLTARHIPEGRPSAIIPCPTGPLQSAVHIREVQERPAVQLLEVQILAEVVFPA